MASSLLIVESPSKERTIGKILGKNFVIKSSYGHIRDLPTDELGLDLENGFEPRYLPLPRTKKILPELEKLAAAATTVYLATDFDREGEAIAWHLSEILKLSPKKARRITFHEITPAAIQEAIKHPRDLDLALVHAQTARRALDRLVGYKLSPLLWRKIRRGLSAGRVQSVAVRLICAREEEIEKFIPEEYWTLTALLDKSGVEFPAHLYALGAEKLDKFSFRAQPALQAVLDGLAGAVYTVDSVDPRERRRQPQAPFTTATLQQDSSRRLRFTAQRTMMTAQKLYEGAEVEKGQGPVGLITYMRTDSVNIAQEARDAAQSFIAERWGKNHLPPTPRVYRTKSKRAQEAHEAIRPTSPDRTPESVKDQLDNDMFRLYELIWQRFMASQMADAVYDTLTVDIRAREALFRATGHVLKFPGFLAAYGESAEEGSEDSTDVTLPPLSRGEVVTLKELKPDQHFTEPPPRYSEATLVKVLEENGIGRPSTYAPIIQTIQTRNYVRMEDRRLHPTTLGRAVDKELQTHFAEIVDPAFTARLEDKLDEVAENTADWKKVVGEFYQPFAAKLLLAETNMQRVKIAPQVTEEKCPKCQAVMFMRENRFGRFLACSRYPECRSTLPVDREGKKIVPLETDELCPKCGKPMMLRQRGRSRFLACTGYPQCRSTFSVDKEGKKIIRPAPEPTDIKCQKCGKPMLKRQGRRGFFLTCSGFPRCRNLRHLSAKEGEPPRETPGVTPAPKKTRKKKATAKVKD